MKKLLVSLLLLSGCATYDKVALNPTEYGWDGMIPMEWNQEYPVDTWRATIKLDEPFTGSKGFYYVLRKYEGDPSGEWYILEVNINKNENWGN